MWFVGWPLLVLICPIHGRRMEIFRAVLWYPWKSSVFNYSLINLVLHLCNYIHEGNASNIDAYSYDNTGRSIRDWYFRVTPGLYVSVSRKHPNCFYNTKQLSTFWVDIQIGTVSENDDRQAFLESILKCPSYRDNSSCRRSLNPEVLSRWWHICQYASG